MTVNLLYLKCATYSYAMTATALYIVPISLCLTVIFSWAAAPTLSVRIALEIQLDLIDYYLLWSLPFHSSHDDTIQKQQTAVNGRVKRKSKPTCNNRRRREDSVSIRGNLCQACPDPKSSSPCIKTWGWRRPPWQKEASCACRVSRRRRCPRSRRVSRRSCKEERRKKFHPGECLAEAPSDKYPCSFWSNIRFFKKQTQLFISLQRRILRLFSHPTWVSRVGELWRFPKKPSNFKTCFGVQCLATVEKQL